MNRSLTRRAALGAALTAPLVSLPGVLLPVSAADTPMPQPASTGFLTVPVEGILIGLLLPAVQAAREARLQLIDSRGDLILSIPLEGGAPSFFDVFYGDGSVTPVDTRRSLVVKERSGKRVWEVPTHDGILIALLLPAVQRNGRTVGFLAGSVQVGGAEGQVSQILPFIEQSSLKSESEGTGISFVGPFTAGPGEAILIGLLLPAVQKVREAARFVLLNSDGKLVAQDRIIAPPESQSGPFTAFYELLLGDGSVRVERRMADGSVRVGEGASPDGILIGLLLPAVQSGDRTVGLLGGSLQTPSTTVAFQEANR